MDPSPTDFHASEGDDPAAVIGPFVRFVLREARKTFVGVRVTRTRNGVSVVAQDRPQSFAGVWEVRLSGDNGVRIGAGRVNGRLPWLDGRGLDGLDEDGEPHPEGVPTLALDGPGERRRSYVGILLTVDPATGAMNEEDREALTMAHRGTLHPDLAQGGAPDEEGVGFWPVAQVEWDRDGVRPVRVRQWAVFHYQHRMAVPVTGRARHFFRPW